MKIKIKLIILSWMMINWSLVGQVHHKWSFGIGSKDTDYTTRSFADHAGYIYSMMEMLDSVDIDPGPGLEMIVPENGNSLILTKTDEDGNLVFGIPFYGNENSYGAITEVVQNQIRLIIDFRDSLSYDHNGQREKLFSQPGKHNAILTLDLDGNITDSHFFHSSEELYFSSFHTLPDGRILLGGTFNDTFALSPQSPFTLYSGGDSDAFILMADKNYNTQWIRQFKGNGNDNIFAMSVSDQNRIYFSAGFSDTISMVTQQGPITEVSEDQEDSFFGYMNLSGNIEKVFFIGGLEDQNIRDIQSDASGNIYICGLFESTANFAGTSQAPEFHSPTALSDGFVAKYDENGNLVWVDIYTNTHSGTISNLELKRGNELYVSGSFTLKADLNPGPDSLIVQGDYNSSPFISKLSLNGDFIWSMPFLTVGSAGISGLMINTETSRIAANGFFFKSIHCSETPDENWLHTDYGTDFFLMSFSEENVITATQDQAPVEIGVYPNPTSGQIHINAEQEIKQVSVQSFDGKLIGNWNFTPSEHQEMDLQGLPSGMYYLSIQSGDQWSTEKIVVQ